MPCGGCGGARRMLVQSARRLDIHGVAGAIRQAAQVNLDKMRGTYDDRKYVDRSPPTVKARPYQRPPERSE